MILFDELGLAEQSKTKPLKVLHSKLEYDGKKDGTCFIGISNYSLDAAKVNRALSLSVPNLEDKLDQLKITAESIVKSISDDIDNNNLIFLGVVTKIPLIIVGKPGTGKSLSSQLIYNSMRGEYSKNPFFKNYPKIDQIYFQGSKNTNPEDVEELFKKSEELSNVYKKDNDK